MQQEGRWNHNIHYHGEVLRRVPPGARAALDVGCGAGMLTRELATAAGHAVGIDTHEPSLRIARDETSSGHVEYIHDDFLTHPFAPESFDLIASVAALHHLGTEPGLRRMAGLLRPGGRLVVVGLGATRSPSDLWHDGLGFWWHRINRWRYGLWQHPSPIVLDGIDSHQRVRRTAQNLLPGMEFRRLVLFRHLLVWEKP